MNTILKQIDGISCEIETVDGYTDICIAQENSKLLTEWIVRKAPVEIAEQIASIVIQHLLRSPEPPEELRGTVDISKPVKAATPESKVRCEAWFTKEHRTVSHRIQGEDEVIHAVISFRIGSPVAFELAYRTILE
jgi:hypothetical protein